MNNDDESLHQLIASMTNQIKLVRGALEFKARQLVQQFIAKRKQLQDIEKAALHRSLGYRQRTNATYSPLCLGTRVHKKSLEISWFLTHRSRRNANAPHMKLLSHHRSLPASKRRGSLIYTTRTLKKFCRHWEESLVLETEARASELRSLNTQTTALWRANALLLRRVEATAPTNAIAETADKPDQTLPDELFVDDPMVAPQPPLHRRGALYSDEHK